MTVSSVPTAGEADVRAQDRSTAPAAPTFRPSVVAELATLLANDAVNAEYRHLVASCSTEAAAAQPGQFFQLLCPHSEGEQPFLRRVDHAPLAE